MSVAVLDPAAAVAEAIRELVDSVRQLVEPDTDDPGVLDELSRMLGRARRRINKAKKAAGPPLPVPKPSAPASTATQPTTGGPAVAAEVTSARAVTVAIPEASNSVVAPRDPQPVTPQRQPGATPMSHTQPPPMQPHYQPPAPRRRRRIWPWVLIGAFVLIAGGCIAVLANAGKEIKDQSRPVLVTYEVTGQGIANANNITYVKDVNLGQEQLAAGTPLPWKHDVQFGEGFFKPLSLVAQAGDGAGAITCRILVDGAEVTKSTSQGQFAVVTCSGDVPRR